MDKIEKALRVLRRKKKKTDLAFARGGDIDEFDPTEGGQIPKSLQHAMRAPPSTWTRPFQRYADGGATFDERFSGGENADDMIAKARDRLAGPRPLPDVGEPAIGNGGQFSPGTAIGNRAADIGSKIGGQAVINAATMFPRYIKATVDAAKQPVGSEGAREAYKDVGDTTGELAMSMIGGGGKPVPGTSGVFVGPYGALALRNKARETGNIAAEKAMVHPVVGKEIQEEVSRLHPALRDTYRTGVQSSRDEWARATLEARAAKGDFRDRDVFARSGWSFTADGKPAKEISDIGAKVSPVSGTNKFSYDHPAGDFHKVYDIPPINRDKATPHEAYFRVRNDTPEIGIRDNPTKKAGSVGHELQHAISFREGWPKGSNPAGIPSHLWNREYYPSSRLPEYQKEMFIRADPKMSKPENLKKLETRESDRSTADVAGYLHSAGENQAFNTQARRAKSFNYLLHPEDTEIVPRAFQHVEYRASGGSAGGFNPERGAAVGLARQGMIKSSVPGRTDKLNMNVPSGSYVIPADIPSAIGQGNSIAGGQILDKMFNKGPYGMNLPRAKSGTRIGQRRSSLSKAKMGFAEGGEVGQATPIVAAGMEYLVHPETILELGGGNIDAGHEILDAFVKQVRSKHISTLKGLKPPKGSS